MGIEKRGNRGYHYRKRRTKDGRVISEYVGPADVYQTLLARALEAQREINGPAVRAAFAAHVERADVGLNAHRRAVRAVAESMLWALGFHKRKGEWRRRRGFVPPSTSGSPQTMLPVPFIIANGVSSLDWAFVRPIRRFDVFFDALMSTLPDPFAHVHAHAEQTVEILDRWLARLRENPLDIEAVAELRQLLLDHPTIWAELGAASRRTAVYIARVLYPNKLAGREAILQGMDRLRESLGYLSEPPIIRLMIDDVAIARADLDVTRVVATAMKFKSVKGKHASYWEDRLATVEKRHQRAVRELARTTKLVRSTKAVHLEASRAIDPRDEAEPPPGMEHPDGGFQRLSAHAFFREGEENTHSDGARPKTHTGYVDWLQELEELDQVSTDDFLTPDPEGWRQADRRGEGSSIQ